MKIIVLTLLVCTVGAIVPLGKTKMAFKTSVRCKAAPKIWCYSFRFYVQDSVRTDQFLTPEIYTCTTDKIHTARLIGMESFDEMKPAPYQVHFISHHNCSSLQENIWRTVDLHYQDVKVEPARQKFRIRLDLTDNGHIEKNMTSRDLFF